MLVALMILALFALSALLWWKLSSLQGQNQQLRSEVTRLRGKLRELQH